MTADTNPWKAGWQGKCPRCGEGKLYQSYLKTDVKCLNCGLDFSQADPGDGAVPFVTLVTGAVGVIFGVILLFVFAAGMLVTIVASSIVAIILTLFMLPKTKALLIAMQYKYKAGDEGSTRFRDDD